MSSLDNCMLHKKEKKEGIAQWNLNAAIEYAEKNSNHKAAEKLCVAIKRIIEWRQNNLNIFERIIKPKNKRLQSGGRKPLDQQLENQLV